VTSVADDEIIAASRRRAMSVTANSVQGSANGFPSSGLVDSSMGAGNHATNTTIPAGSGSYTYSWVVASQIQGSPQNTPTPTAANPVFRSTVNTGVPSISNWTVTANDSLSGLSAQTTIQVQLTWTQNPPTTLNVTGQDFGGDRSGGGASNTVTSQQGGSIHNPNIQVTNGSGSYSYQWVKVTQLQGGNQSGANLTTPVPLISAVVQTGVASVANWRCDVTDLVSGFTGSVTVKCGLVWTQGGGGGG
jgi:hypothetical protein